MAAGFELALVLFCKRVEDIAAVMQLAPCTEVEDLRRRVSFYEEHCLESGDSGNMVATLLAENMRLQQKLQTLEKKLSFYLEFCVCFDEMLEQDTSASGKTSFIEK